MDEVEVLAETAVLGEQVDAFLRSNVGKYLLVRAERVYIDGIEGLKTATPTDSEKIREYQNMVFRAESFRKWLEDAVSDGLKALEILEERE